jgi:hypothetical protein
MDNERICMDLLDINSKIYVGGRIVYYAKVLRRTI